MDPRRKREVQEQAKDTMRKFVLSLGLPAFLGIGCSAATSDLGEEDVTANSHAASVKSCVDAERAVLDTQANFEGEARMLAAQKKAVACVSSANDRTRNQIEDQLAKARSPYVGKTAAIFQEFRADSDKLCELSAVGAADSKHEARLRQGCLREREVVLSKLIDAYVKLGVSKVDLARPRGDECYGPFYGQPDERVASRELSTCSYRRYLGLAEQLGYRRVQYGLGGVRDYDTAHDIAETALAKSSSTTKRVCDLLVRAAPSEFHSPQRQPDTLAALCRADVEHLWWKALLQPIPLFSVGRTRRSGDGL